jgi:hypothetical protein
MLASQKDVVVLTEHIREGLMIITDPGASVRGEIYAVLESQVTHAVVVFDADFNLVEEQPFLSQMHALLEESNAKIDNRDVLAITLSEGSVVATLSLRSGFVRNRVEEFTNDRLMKIQISALDGEAAQFATGRVVSGGGPTLADSASSSSTARTLTSPNGVSEVLHLVVLYVDTPISSLTRVVLDAFAAALTEILCEYGTASYTGRNECAETLDTTVLKVMRVTTNVTGSADPVELTRIEVVVFDRVLATVVDADDLIQAIGLAFGEDEPARSEMLSLVMAHNGDSSLIWRNAFVLTNELDNAGASPRTMLAGSLSPWFVAVVVTFSLLSCVAGCYICVYCRGDEAKRGPSPFLAVKQRGKARLYYNTDAEFSATVRASPQTWDPPLGVIMPGERVTVLESRSGWLKIQAKAAWGDGMANHVWAKESMVDGKNNEERAILMPVPDASSFYPIVNIDGVRGIEADFEGVGGVLSDQPAVWSASPNFEYLQSAGGPARRPLSAHAEYLETIGAIAKQQQQQQHELQRLHQQQHSSSSIGTSGEYLSLQAPVTMPNNAALSPKVAAGAIAEGFAGASQEPGMAGSGANSEPDGRDSVMSPIIPTNADAAVWSAADSTAAAYSSDGYLEPRLFEPRLGQRTTSESSDMSALSPHSAPRHYFPNATPGQVHLYATPSSVDTLNAVAHNPILQSDGAAVADYRTTPGQ